MIKNAGKRPECFFLLLLGCLLLHSEFMIVSTFSASSLCVYGNCSINSEGNDKS